LLLESEAFLERSQLTTATKGWKRLGPAFSIRAGESFAGLTLSAFFYAGISGEARSEQTLSSINVGMTARF